MRPAWGVVRDANKGNDPKPAFAISCVLIAQTPLRCTAMHATTVSPLLLLTGPSFFFDVRMDDERGLGECSGEACMHLLSLSVSYL